MFRDRAEAAVRLADEIGKLHPEDPVVLALPRGGVPLGVVVAERLGAPLDLLLVRKVGMPGHEELAVGAVVDGEDLTTFFNEEILRASGLTEANFASRIDALRQEIEARRRSYLQDRKPEPVAGRTAIIVDDGIATGATVRVSIRALRARSPAEVWVAAPVAPRDTIRTLRLEADRVIFLEAPEPFWAVGAHYRDFGQVSDEEVVSMMQGSGGGGPA